MNSYFRKNFSIIGFLCLIFSLDLYSQETEYERWRKSKDQEYNDYREQRDSEYLQFQEDINKEWESFLRQRWQEYQVFKGIEPPKDPDPITYPTYNQEEVKEESWGTFTQEEKVEKKEVLLPLDRGAEKKGRSFQSISLDFYGSDYSIIVDRSLVYPNSVSVTEDFTADFWKYVAGTNYLITLDDLLRIKEKLNLNDFSYALLVYRFSKELVRNDDLSICYTWFFLLNSRYNLKIGKTFDHFDLRIPVSHTVYSRSSFKIGDYSYYSFKSIFSRYIGESFNAINTSYYGTAKDFPGAEKIFYFGFKKPLNLPLSKKTRTLSFKNNGQQYDISVNYNMNEIEMLKWYPQCDLSIFVNSPISTYTRESLQYALAPYLEGKTNFEKVEFLLRLTQNSFDYKTDDDQFEYEKWFFPTEILYYPYSDCDDRAIFYSRLVYEFTENEVATLLYPKHVATAVKFTTGNPKGEYVTLNDSQFVVCDPTYTNAPVGKGMSKYKDVTAKQFVTLVQPTTTYANTLSTEDNEYFVLDVKNIEQKRYAVLQDIKDPNQLIVLESENRDVTNSWEFDLSKENMVGNGGLFTLDKNEEVNSFIEGDNFDGYGVVKIEETPILILESGENYSDRFDPLTQGNVTSYINEMVEELSNTEIGKEMASLVSFFSVLNGKDFILNMPAFLKSLGGKNGSLYEQQPDIYKILDQLDKVICNQNIFTIELADRKSLSVDKLKISDGARFRLVTYGVESHKLEIINGFNVGAMVIWYDLNYLRIDSQEGELTFDYGKNNDKAVIALNDMLE